MYSSNAIVDIVNLICCSKIMLVQMFAESLYEITISYMTRYDFVDAKRVF